MQTMTGSSEIFLSNYAVINLQNPLARLPGVALVRIFGAGPYSMRVWLDPLKLDSLGITTADVQAAIQGQNDQVALGQLGAPSRTQGATLPAYDQHARPPFRRRPV